MNTKMSNISHGCRSCSSCFLQAAIGGTGTGSITTLHQAGFLSSRSQASVTETAVSKPERAQRFIWTVEQLISIRSTSLPGACIQVPWPRPHQRPVRNIHFPGSTAISVLEGDPLSFYREAGWEGQNMETINGRISSTSTDPRIYQCISLCFKLSHSKVQEVVRLEHVYSYC